MSLDDLATTGIVLLADHQHGPAERGTTATAADVDRHAATLVRAAAIYDMPVVISAVGMAGAPKLTPQVSEAAGGIRVHERGGTDSMSDPAIAGAIEATGRKTLLIAGILTEIAVQRAALSAKAKGYDVRVVLDACNGRSERSEWAAIERMTSAGIIMTSVPAVLGELMVDFSDPRMQQVRSLLMG